MRFLSCLGKEENRINSRREKYAPRGNSHGAAFLSDHIGLKFFRYVAGIHSNRQNDFNSDRFRETVDPVNEGEELLTGIIFHNFKEIVNIKMADIVIAGMNSAKKSLELVVGIDSVVVRTDQSCLIGNIIGQTVFSFDTDDAALILFYSFLQHGNKVTSFAGTFLSDD